MGAWGHSYLLEWSPAELAEVTLQRQAAYGWDFVKFQPRASCFVEALGSVYRRSGDPHTQPIMERSALWPDSNWERIAEAAGRSLATPLTDQVESIRRVCAALGERVPVIQTVFSPATVAAYLFDRDHLQVLRAVRETPDAVLPALEAIAGMLRRFAEASIEAGAAGIFYAITNFNSRSVMPVDEYRNTFLAGDLTVLQGVPDAAWFNVVHLCGEQLQFDLLADLPAAVVNWEIGATGNPGLAEVRDQYRRPVMGGVDQRRRMLEATPDEVVAEVRAAVAATGGRGLLVAPGCSVPTRVPERNLAALASALR